MTLDWIFQTHLQAPAQSAPDPHDEENMDARPDQEEMEQAINKFLQRLEKQEKEGFKDLVTLLSQLAKPAQGSARSMSGVEAVEAGFLTALDEDQACTFTPLELLLYRHSQESGPQVTKSGYPGLSQFIW